ncbi:replication-associated recombination protein A [Chloroflexota bacterium]
MTLFEHYRVQHLSKEAPLAARMRPQTLVDFVGQEHLVGVDRVLRKSIESDQLISIIFWGPPGSGKTTLARIIANTTKSHFSQVSAVSASVADLRRIIAEAKDRYGMYQKRTILFIDEIHRFNKAQQDSVLPYVEDGTVTLIGATTENPSFEVISALLSRCRVYTLKSLTEENIRTIVKSALADKEYGLGNLKVDIEEKAIDHLVMMTNGDGRMVLNALELSVYTTAPDNNGERKITLEAVEDALQHRSLIYDKAGEEHYNLISALHKSLRGSDPDGGLYWLARMLEAGEDPLYICRRLVRFASEDVGMADPQALVVAIAAQQAFHFIGLPEGNLALAEVVVYLATAPKSNALYVGYSKVERDVKTGKNDPVPLHLRNAVTELMKDEGYGRGYKYDHDFKDHFSGQQHLPDSVAGNVYYRPGDEGFEKEIKQRLDKWWPNRKQEKRE